jgi:uncharacterized protein YutE (UPF0331/DUF86 family)
LQRVSDDIGRLRRYERMDRDDILDDDTRTGDMLRRFQTAIEGCIDAAQHVCASEGWGPPDSNAHAMLILGEHDVIPRDLAEAMSDHARFRNVLVHLYADVDEARAVDRLSRLNELERYVAAVAELLAGAEE